MDGPPSSESVNEIITFLFLKDEMFLPVDQSQFDIQKAQARITELEEKFLSRQGAIDRLGLEMEELQVQLGQCPVSSASKFTVHLPTSCLFQGKRHV